VKPIQQMTQAEVGAYVHSHLRKKGIDVVLSGGAAVGIYSGGKYVSQDLDLVRGFTASRRALASAMKEIGFEETQGRYFKHPQSQHFIEFPPGPLTVGEEPVKQVEEIEFPTGMLRVISPTDSVKDRLASYYHFGDRQGLIQATMVASQNEVDLEEIRRWSAGERGLSRFEDFLAALQSSE
jgi:hypothetical protein